MNTPILLLALALQANALTIDQAVESALANHPDARVAQGQSQAAQARARQTKGSLLPQARLSASYDLATRHQYGLPSSSGDSWGAAVSGDQLLWDFGRSSNRWRAALASAASTSQGTEATGNDLVLDVRLAFIDTLQSQALVAVGRQTLENQERHLTQTQQFVEAGTRPAIDLAKLRTQVASARSALIRVQNDLLVAKARLNLAMGRTGGTDYPIAAASLPALEIEGGATEELFAAAVEHRPELAAQRSSLVAQELGVKIAEQQLLPSLKLGAAAGYSANELTEPGWNASVGLNLSWTLFDGFASPAGAEAERATLIVEQARLTGREQQLWQEIESARGTVGSAKAALAATEQGVQSARELLLLAEARYAEGVGDALELSDAELELANAEVQWVQSQYDVAAARAQLLRAVGRRDWR